jgi:hypothetical protein
MIKKRVGNQIGKIHFWPQIPLDHESNDFWLGCVTHSGKVFLKDIRYCACMFQKGSIWGRYECPKFQNDKSPNFGTPT